VEEEGMPEIPVYLLGGDPVRPSDPTRDLITLFLKLGFTGFGGPAAVIAIMKDEVVARRRWMTEAEFLDLLGATNLIPGPNSTQMALHIGLRRAGWIGLVVAGACFITPAAIIVLFCAWAYIRYGSLPQAEALLYGVKPVIIAIILCAIWGLARTAVKNLFHVGLGIAALALAMRNVDVLLVLFAAGALAATVDWLRREPQRESGRGLLLVFAIAAAMIVVPDMLTRFGKGSGSTPVAYGPFALFSFFLKIGMTLYGGGYVLIAFLRDGLVNQWQWLTEPQLLDAIAVGQITPGPLFTTATFVGYLAGGLPGAAIATVAIFLPSFVLVALSGPLIPRLRRSRLAGAFLDGVNVSALALMAAVTADLGKTALVDIYTVSTAIVSGVLLLRYRVNSVWLIAAAALCGIVFRQTT
jgi:chromate transporter